MDLLKLIKQRRDVNNLSIFSFHDIACNYIISNIFQINVCLSVIH